VWMARESVHVPVPIVLCACQRLLLALALRGTCVRIECARARETPHISPPLQRVTALGHSLPRRRIAVAQSLSAVIAFA
jgi:hypothetical protein